MPKIVPGLVVAVAATGVLAAPASAAITGPTVTSTATTVTFEVGRTGTPAFSRVYVDTDRSAATGYAQGGIGADYLLENGSLYRHNGGGWAWTQVRAVPFTSSGSIARWTVERADLGEQASPNDVDVVFQVEAPVETSAKVTHTYTGGAGGSVAYQPSTANVPNPERGLYHHTGDCDKADLSADALRKHRTEQGITLAMCVFYLAEYRSSPIAQTALDRLQRQFDAARVAGVKLVLRFAYTASESGEDAPKDRVLAHIDQLTPLLRANADVTAVVQAGFVGAWGEWYYTRNFGNAGVVSATDQANRKAVVDKLLTALPANRAVQLRTPKFKRALYAGGNTRVGHHNDCFLASDTDFGTYEDPATEHPYLEAETRSLPMGGETCAVNPPRTDCPTATAELSRFHWTYLNTDYQQDVLRAWSAQGCLAEVTTKLGYRFTLRDSVFPTTTTRGAALPVRVNLTNDGYAAAVNQRTVNLVLRNTTTGALTRLPLTADPRTWLPGARTIAQDAQIPPSLATGTYALLLELADPALPGRPEYSIQTANTGLWDAATGLTDLKQTITVS
ncbi:DUF4832 domain-containing protein [Actinosynnema mirum]|uniref:DUF4832 domain-containing protein n=1 Tax=Actinosynnema mirum (strain ATCC 29888 / DSM 43827 / JCM 3225 / NBRC 14064 / NCIMB 13271 / NRRL B-12336 / IMRU 3971 / 101) TaxID=446462 RepID=C6W8L9_ACTMD|nr:DUF4832 domain-containing protein [Actinosynnema mirum]ACU37118.1 hypothetical protein Amir_3209 [Actinosynnema mirum DSM 43827]